MEFQIKNHYIKRFLQKHSSQNEIKVLKYLTILGIHSLENAHQGDISFNELKRRAKEISTQFPKESKKLDNELKIIKNELERLNKKFEEKINLTWTESNIANLKESKEEISKSKTEPAERGRTAQRPPLKQDNPIPESRKANSLEPRVHPEWWFSYNETKSRRNSLTPKPNEIELPYVVPSRNSNLKIKHHLDDSEAYFSINPPLNFSRQAFKEEEAVAKRVSTKPQQKTAKQAQNNSEKKIPPQQVNSDSKRPPQKPALQTHSPKEPNQNVNNSPKFHQMQEIFDNIQSIKERIAEKENSSSSNNLPVPRDREIVKNKEYSFKNENKKTHEDHRRSPPKKNLSKKSPGKNSTKFKTNQTVSIPKKTQPANSTAAIVHDMKEVRSKIKSDVDYDKELAKQYKQMKEDLKRHGGYVDEAEIAEMPRVKDKFQLIQREVDKEREKKKEIESKNIHHPSKLAESTSSNGNYSAYYNYKGRNNKSNSKEPPEYQKNNDYDQGYEEQSDYRPSTGVNQGGMLEIANSFLNSPLMHHLSNMDSKNSDASSKESSNPNTLVKNYSGVRINNFETKSPSGRAKSPNQRYDIDDESKVHENISQNHKYSDWVGIYKSDSNLPKSENSNLKESSYKRYGDYGARDSRYLNKDEGSSSLTSSNFSNFLNEEMRGFYQKETFDLKRSKNSRSQNKINGPSEHSSNISFNANEGQPAHEENNMQSRKSAYQDNNKSYIGNSYDGGNIFKQERMSVTRLLNNTNY